MISLGKIYFQTYFGTYQTNYNTGNVDRTTNLRLAWIYFKTTEKSSHIIGL